MGKYIIYTSSTGFTGTTEKNYKAYIQDARKNHHFNRVNGFENIDDVIKYVTTYFRYAIDDIIFIG